jgi:hypothetical protein
MPARAQNLLNKKLNPIMENNLIPIIMKPGTSQIETAGKKYT